MNFRLYIMRFREYSVVGCLPLFQIGKEVWEYEENGILNRITIKHYSPFITPYCNDIGNKKRHLSNCLNVYTNLR